MSSMGSIYNEFPLSNFINVQRSRLIDEIDKLKINRFTNLEDIVLKFKAKYTFGPLKLKDAEISEPNEEIVSEQTECGENRRRKIFKIDVQIPFDGDCDLFRSIASSGPTIVYLEDKFTISRSAIQVQFVMYDLNPDTYKKKLENFLNKISANIPQINKEIEPWDNCLESFIKVELAKRQNLDAKKNEFMEKIGLKKSPDADTYLVPAPIAKKTIPSPVQSVAAQTKSVIPTLLDDIYSDIKQVIYNVGTAIERKPSIYEGKDEESLRDIFLLFLETRYEATTATGETFNKGGKTDILLKYANDGSNIFIAECKFWHGQAEFHNAIDQLFRYVTHRDTKTALIIFVDLKNITQVIEKIKEEAPKHSNYLSAKTVTNNTSLCYEFHLPDDKQKTIYVEIIIFHYPKPL